ncbi:MAG: DUF1273 family protein [Clostridia bacterium]|nr:DUF1273 family protein [Clostridia bacterium]
MKRETTATFIGHSHIFNLDKTLIRSKIIEFIENGVTDFLCGGMGEFDVACANVLYEVKTKYPGIKSYLVVPYKSFKVRDRIIYDSVIYPSALINYDFKNAIPARNEWMVDNSAYALCFVTHESGGAAKTYAAAKKKELHIVNLGE